MSTSWWHLIKSGTGRWYALVFVSLMIGIINPFVILGFILGLHVKNGYTGETGLSLTVISYLVSLAGFGLAERSAYLDGNIRGLELASILAMPISFVAFLAGMVAPSRIMWPLAFAILLVSIGGLHAANALAEAQTPKDGEPATATPSPVKRTAQPKLASMIVKSKRERRRQPVRRRSN
ncbi:MAG: hypothetical protein ACREQE_11960 [Candidatus Binataceae bacterium]